jgi:hypothetical protein
MTRSIAIGWIRLVSRNIGAGSDACADSSARRPDHASRGRLPRVGGVCVARTRARAVPATGCGRTPTRPLSFTEDCLESSRLRIINASHPHIHSAVAGSLLTPRLNFRDGSKTEVAALKRHVRSTLHNRHRQAAPPCPFRARSGRSPDKSRRSD